MNLTILLTEVKSAIDPTVTAAAIATLLSSVVASTVALKINSYNSLKSLNDQLDAILKIAIQYPYLENPSFCSSWNENKDLDKDEYLRYEMYCNLIFNYLERLCKYHKFNRKKINNHLDIKGWIMIHKDCWLNPTISNENDGYDTRLKKLIENYLS